MNNRRRGSKLLSNYSRFKQGINPAILPIPKKNKPKKHTRIYSFLLWNGDIHTVYHVKSIRAAYIKIRDIVDPDLIAYIFPYATPLPMMLHTDGCLYYWQYHPGLFENGFIPLKDGTKMLYDLIMRIRA